MRKVRYFVVKSSHDAKELPQGLQGLDFTVRNSDDSAIAVK